MKSMQVTDVEKNLRDLLQQTATLHEPLRITGEDVNGILLSEEDWKTIQETLSLFSRPALQQPILEQMRSPVRRCSEELCW